jgi:integrase
MSGIEEYLTENFEARKTQNTYRAVLNKYFKVIGESPETYFNNGKTQEDYLNDIKKYINVFLKGKPSKTCLSYLSGIKSYLRHNKVKIDPDELKTIIKRHKGMGSNRALTKDRPPSLVELRQILTHGDVLDKTFYLMLLSSGMRIGELSKLPLNVVHMDENPVRIDIPSTITKNGERRTTFISKEASNFLIEWLKVRDAHIRDVMFRTLNLPNKVKDVIRADDPRVFPFNPVTAWRRWENMCKKAGFKEKDVQTERAVLHPHALRKFFRTHMGTAIGVDITEELMGHNGYLASEYRNHTDAELGEAYRVGMGAVTVFEREIPQDLTKVNAQLKQKDEEIQQIKEENQKLRNYLQDFEIEMRKLLRERDRQEKK